ncbi:nucleoside diphosphate kinase [Toxoplasma gondii TgCatPRC2]|uniref:Nucleoside diphosphate kinase n=10 Tax=Toxoplasma gondii TaxID=5811 RepID=B9PUP5_TOXGV|nr:nucleoside diphosphate kinase [Toxoplasma gondii ME49]EPR61564.1 nucleoside diphosphate kinase [Toxoplasma gondii GT1]ESS33009.1 nucleoside diphosphate kinase [Toxoplasma gondii VEG]KAF4642953.1 nucleoside diphosphate kinase [Toxoplasma gondii]KFG41002.1 nucleoside diphosphate kinase [Toxoplasma gondii GAB2-2007-GAL-DOM2]KFG45639.1 nucleoside diphosphate kinase [Toxoplasma gondii p89]KFG53613.1 nucleoside diphosphate kinase [Toxoplasma gondii FOU]KYK66572.1 nucleoside diphosphate kinase [|eukprot:XP_018637413.1 nucleoside diphosphate kinase [Toxoplasma gondii ME49]
MVPDTWVFHVTWCDHQADMVKELSLSYNRSDNSVELYDPKLRRLFLKRTPASIPLEGHLYLGNTVTIFSRQLKIVDYGDECTRSDLAPRFRKAAVIVKPHAQKHLGCILQRLTDSGFILSGIQTVQLDHQKAKRLLDIMKSPQSQPENNDTAEQTDADTQTLTDGRAVVVEIVGHDSKQRLEYIVGAEDPAQARQQSPSSLRAAYGISRTQNAVLWSALEDDSLRHLPEFLSATSAATLHEIGRDCSCCVIKPSALRHAGKIVDEILTHGFRITAIQSFHLSRNAADEFYEVYKTVLAEYSQMIDELTQGVCLAMQVEHEENDSVARLRQLSGPHDPELAKCVRPQSLRAKFGSDRVRNAVHCTDLVGDALLETQYFFSLLARSQQ